MAEGIAKPLKEEQKMTFLDAYIMNHHLATAANNQIAKHTLREQVARLISDGTTRPVISKQKDLLKHKNEKRVSIPRVASTVYQ